MMDCLAWYPGCHIYIYGLVTFRSVQNGVVRVCVCGISLLQTFADLIILIKYLLFLIDSSKDIRKFNSVFSKQNGVEMLAHGMETKLLGNKCILY